MKYRIIALGLMTTLGMLSMPMPAKAISNETCHEVAALLVAMAVGQPTSQTISGTLCTPAMWAEGDHQIDVLVHGATYNRTYWDWPMGTGQYSYVNRTLQAGRATFAYDRLGTGNSSRPLGALSTLEADAYVMHQVVQWLKTTHSYTQVNAVGHSVGSTVVISEAGTYKDVDRVVITGAIHGINVGALLRSTKFYPATLDSQFTGLLDPTYLTTVPGSRGNLFYNNTAEPAVIEYDEAHKDKTPAANIAGIATQLETPAVLNISRHITAPVFVVMGANDIIVCSQLLFPVNCAQTNSIRTKEAPYYTSAESFTALSIPDTGHNLTLHPSAGTSFNAINAWIISH